MFYQQWAEYSSLSSCIAIIDLIILSIRYMIAIACRLNLQTIYKGQNIYGRSLPSVYCCTGDYSRTKPWLRDHISHTVYFEMDSLQNVSQRCIQSGSLYLHFSGVAYYLYVIYNLQYYVMYLVSIGKVCRFNDQSKYRDRTSVR